MHALISKAVPILCVFAILGNLLNIGARIHYKISRKPRDNYTYQGHDYPETLPLPTELPEIVYKFEESNQYPVSGLKSDSKWLSLSSSSFGYIRLGEPNRLFMVTMFHELHCLRVLNLAFEPSGFQNTPGPIDEAHIKHCFDYLRQMALCTADLTLEEGDFVRQGHTEAAEYTCKDWKVVYETMESNWNNWNKFDR